MSMPLVRDLVLVSDRELRQMTTGAEALWAAWAAQWLAARAPLAAPRVDRLETWAESCADEAASWLPVGSGMIWRQTSALAVAALARALIHAAPNASLAEDDWALNAARSALADLDERLLGAIGIDEAHDDAPPSLDEARQTWAGSLVLSCDLSGSSWLLPRHVHAAWTAGAAKSQAVQAVVVPVSQVLSTQKTRLDVNLGHVEIAVSQLMDLQPGDVIRFPTLLSDPLPVNLGGGAQGPAPLACRLGHRNEHVAIQITPAAATP